MTWQSARLAVAEAADLAEWQDGFTYRGRRDITGFIDGAPNRRVRPAAEVAVVRRGARERAAATS